MPNIHKMLPLLLSLILVTLSLAGASTAKIDPNAPVPQVFVVDTGQSFHGETSIQDAINHPLTSDQNYIYIQPGTYTQQLNITKDLTIMGMGNQPQDTTIQFNGSHVIYIPAGVTVILDNLALTNLGTGPVITGEGLYNTINCLITENIPPEAPTQENTANYLEPQNTPESTTTESKSDETTTEPQTTETTIQNTENPTSTTTEESETENTTTNQDPLENAAFPAASLTWGCMMVIGAVAIPRKNN